MEANLQIDRASIKKPQHLKNNVFLIYSPKAIVADSAAQKLIQTLYCTYLKKQERLSHQNSEVKRFKKLTSEKTDCG